MKKSNKFIINNPGNVIIDFIADDKRHTTTLSLSEDNHLFFSQELFHSYSEEQILIFRYGSKNKENLNIWHFDLRKDLRGNHLNFDNKINGHSVNNIVPSNQKVKKLREFFLHEIKKIPEKLIINIYHLEPGKEIGSQKLVKSYKLKPIL